MNYSLTICVNNCNETENAQSPYQTTLYPTAPLYYYCLPDLERISEFVVNVSVHIEVDIGDNFKDEAETAMRAFSDLYTTWVLLLISGLAAIVISFVVLQLLRMFAGFIVFLSLVFVIVGCFLVSYVLFTWGSDPASDVDPERKKYVNGLGAVIAALTGIFLLICIAMRKRIMIAIEVVKESAHAVQDMKSIIFFPLVPALFAVGYFAFFVVVCIYFWSVRTPFTQEQTDVLRFDELTHWNNPTYPANSLSANPRNATFFETHMNWRKATGYNLFHMLWNVQFFYYFGYLVFAGATAEWYFAAWENPSVNDGSKKRGGDDDAFSHFPVIKSAWRALRYHVGTVAFAALLIAIIQFIRLILAYIEKKTRPADPTSVAAKIRKALFCCVQCILKCLECCLDRINKNALIWTSIWGDAFISSACSSFVLLWGNIGRVAAINVVSDLLLFIAKLGIALINAGIAMIVLTNYQGYKDKISSPFLPCLVVFIIGYVVASVFMAVFSSVIDTVFLCFLIDEETNKHTPGAMRASKRLQELVGHYAAESKKIADDDKLAKAEAGASSVVEMKKE